MFVWACLHKQCNAGPLLPGCLPGTARLGTARTLSVPQSLIYGVITLEGAPPCWGYLLFNLFAEGPSSKQSPSPGPRALRKSKVAVQSTGPILTLHLEEVPKPRICGRKNLYSG